MPSLGLASVTGVANPDTGPISTRREGTSTWQTMRMKTRC